MGRGGCGLRGSWFEGVVVGGSCGSKGLWVESQV